MSGSHLHHHGIVGARLLGRRLHDRCYCWHSCLLGAVYIADVIVGTLVSGAEYLADVTARVSSGAVYMTVVTVGTRPLGAGYIADVTVGLLAFWEPSTSLTISLALVSVGAAYMTLLLLALVLMGAGYTAYVIVGTLLSGSRLHHRWYRWHSSLWEPSTR